MSELPTWARDALAGVYDPCCREKGISVLDMGLVRSVEVNDGVATVELLLTSGWCPFAATVLTEVKEQILGRPGGCVGRLGRGVDDGPVVLQGSRHPPLPALTRVGARPGRLHRRPPAYKGVAA
jgi:hypothetical protein